MLNLCVILLFGLVGQSVTTNEHVAHEKLTNARIKPNQSPYKRMIISVNENMYVIIIDFTSRSCSVFIVQPSKGLFDRGMAV